jgi:opacity protein-like surface antigen
MARFATNTLAAFVLAASASTALGADIIEPPVYEAPEVMPVAAGGWYLRGDIGMTNQRLHGGLENALFANTDNLEFLDSGTFSSAGKFGMGIGYQFGPWFRADVTGEYRGKAAFTGLDRYSDPTADGNPNTFEGSNEYSAYKSEWLFLANGYVDLGSWAGITPYVGAGIGASRNTISGFKDVNTPNGGVAYADSNSEWNMAWALHAGLGYQVTERLTLDLGYSYVNLGDASTGDIISFNGTNAVNNPMIFNDLVSHDFKFGLRYTFK